MGGSLASGGARVPGFDIAGAGDIAAELLEIEFHLEQRLTSLTSKNISSSVDHRKYQFYSDVMPEERQPRTRRPGVRISPGAP